MTDSDRFGFPKLHWTGDALIHEIAGTRSRSVRRYPTVPDRSRSAPGGAA